MVLQCYFTHRVKNCDIRNIITNAKEFFIAALNMQNLLLSQPALLQIFSTAYWDYSTEQQWLNLYMLQVKFDFKLTLN